MKKTIKRGLALLLGATMAMGLTGCAEQKVVTDDDIIHNKEPIALTVFSQTANWSGAQSGWGAVLLKDLFNVELTIIPDTDGAYQTRMEKGELGDIVIWGENDDQYATAVDRGLLFSWDEEDLAKKFAPYIMETFPDAMAANRALNSDGQLYAVGYDLTDKPGDHNTFIYDWGARWDLYKELGYPEVSDLDDLTDVLAQMKEICPTGDDGKPTYGFSLWPDWDGNTAMYVSALATAYTGCDGMGFGHYDSKTGDFYDCLAEDSPYMESLRFFNRLHREGLLDPDSMTQSYDNVNAKARRGSILFSIFDYAGSIQYNTAEHIAENKYMAPLVPKNANVYVQGLSTGGNRRRISIGAGALYPEKCMQVINWLHTPEGAMSIWYGIKGLMWDYDSEGRMYLTELGQACWDDQGYDLTGVEWTSPYTGNTYTLDGTFNDGKPQLNYTTWAFGALNPESNGERFNVSTWESQMGEPKCETDADWRRYTGAEGTQDYMDTLHYTVVPVLSEYSEPERAADLELKWNQVKTAVVNGSWKAMYAGSDAEFESILAQVRKDCDAYGYDECIDWCREQAAIKFAMQEDSAS